MKKVSIIVVNYNTTAEVQDLLNSVEEQPYKDFELLIIDNASADRDIEKLAKNTPEHRFVFLPENLGFAGANNYGISLSKGEYIFLLNPDTLLANNTLSELVKVLETYPKAGAVSPKLIYHKEQLIQYAGSTPLSTYRVQNRHRGNQESDLSLFDKVEQTAFNHGAAMMVKREVIEKVGMMPEEYFVYYEELDWCTSMKRSGYELYYTGKTSVQHKASASTGKIAGLKSYYMTRNRLLFVQRNYVQSWKKFFAMTYLMLVVYPKDLLINRSDLKTIKALTKALVWNINYLFKTNLKTN